MKKLLIALSSISFLARAEEEMESVGEQIADAMEGVTSAANEMISNLSWKTKLMLYWYSMSSLHKMIVLGLVVVLVLWIVFKLMHRRKDSCCK